MIKNLFTNLTRLSLSEEVDDSTYEKLKYCYSEDTWYGLKYCKKISDLKHIMYLIVRHSGTSIYKIEFIGTKEDCNFLIENIDDIPKELSMSLICLNKIYYQNTRDLSAFKKLWEE